MRRLRGLFSASAAQNTGLRHAFRCAWLLFKNPSEIFVAHAIDGDVATRARRHALGCSLRRLGRVVPALCHRAAELASPPKGFQLHVLRHGPQPPVAVDLLASPPSDAMHRDPLRRIACLGQPFGGYTDQEVLRQGGIIRFDSEATSIECQGGLTYYHFRWKSAGKEYATPSFETPASRPMGGTKHAPPLPYGGRCIPVWTVFSHWLALPFYVPAVNHVVMIGLDI